MTFPETAQAALRHIQRWPSGGTVRIVAHQDGDGVAGAAVAVRLMQSLGRLFHVTFSWRRDEQFWTGLERDTQDPMLVLDMGADQLPMLATIAPRGLVVDHHPPGKEPNPRGWGQLNPWLADLDGGRDASGATTMLQLALAADPERLDLAPAALAGAVADKQHMGGFQGPNKTMADAAVAAGTLRRVRHPRLDDLPMADQARWPDATLRRAFGGGGAWLDELSLPRNASPYELGASERQRLASALTLGLLRSGADASDAQDVLEDGYESPAHGDRSLVRLASLADAACRMGDPGLGLALLLGNADASSEVDALESKFLEVVRSQLAAVESNATRLRGIRTARVDDASWLAPVSNRILGRVVEDELPVVVTVMSSGRLVASARATAAHERSGVDLGKLLAVVAAEYGGSGGGHARAAGASVPGDRADGFLAALDSAVAKVIS